MIITVKKLQSLFLVSLFCSFAQVIPSSSTSPKPKGAKRAGCVATGTASPKEINEVTLPVILASIPRQEALTLAMAARYIYKKESRDCEKFNLRALAYAPDTRGTRLEKDNFFTNRSSIENRRQIEEITAELYKRGYPFSLQEWPGLE